MNDNSFYAAWLKIIESHAENIPWYLNVTFTTVTSTLIAAIAILFVCVGLGLFLCAYKTKILYRLGLAILTVFCMVMYCKTITEFYFWTANKIASLKIYDNNALLRDIEKINTQYKVAVSNKQIQQAQFIITEKCNSNKNFNVCPVDSELLHEAIENRILELPSN